MGCSRLNQPINWANQSHAEEDAREPDVIEIPGDDSGERDDSSANVLGSLSNPRGDSESPLIEDSVDEVLSPWDVLHLRWRLREG